MCIFTGPGVSVSGTHIFGRVAEQEQFLVYQMAFGATSDVPMVLRFIDLSTYPKFFEGLDLMFPQDLAISGSVELEP